MPSAPGKSPAPHQSPAPAERVHPHSAETAVNDRLELTPELDLLANTQFATSADTELVSSSHFLARTRPTVPPDVLLFPVHPRQTVSRSTTSSPHPPLPPSSA